MNKRIFGIETEYGLLVRDPELKLDPVEIANRIKNHIFLSMKAGILDLHYRANDEPPGNGGGPYNLLKDLRRMGVKYPLMAQGLVGGDANGRAILKDCAANDFDSAASMQLSSLSVRSHSSNCPSCKRFIAIL